ncbi:histidine kinase [Micromonospora sp. RHAY321]|uniref:sensor histidine kinase n=1 Tax=Micromonospora sp. RHAY321 TaxID=2944807 RepID=UPI00207C8B53|nr:histidine kinase [Micromonospora sp. RHAY321]MCO1595833.1 histidine kinase [Micromonospora sp. RHAY321]
MRIPRWPAGAAWGVRPALLADALLWAVLAAPMGFARLTPPYSPRTLALLLGGLAVLAVAVALGRRRPLVGLSLVVLASLVDGNFVFAIPVFSYLTGRRSAGATPAAVLFGVIAVGGTVLNLGLLGTEAATWFLLASVLLFAGVFPWLVGRYRRQQRELADADRRHADALAREQRGAGDRIRLRERARIAEEMHDSLGHDLSLIALRAAALELADDLDPRHRAAVGELRASVAAATERLHGIIGVLREEGGSAGLRPAGETVTDVVDGAREAGMTVLLDAPPTVVELPGMTGLAAHRVVREALTNAARYAPGAPVTVTLAPEANEIEVRVLNGPPPAGPLPTPPSSGSGLLALAERVRLAGGVLDTGPRPDGGFEVRARLPMPADGVPADPTVGVPAGLRSAEPGAVTGAGSAGGGMEWPADAERRLQAARRRVRRSLLTALAAPAGLALALSLVYYPFATAGTVLDEATYDRMRPGTARADLAGLPRRQVTPPSGGEEPGCEFYTDGNFPLAQPTWRLCFTDGRLVDKERIA